MGYGGQILLSLVSAKLVHDSLSREADLKNMGIKRLNDLTRPETVFQLVHPDLPRSFLPLKSLDSHPNNLPTQPTPLIGRERELGLIRSMLTDRAARIVTLTGTGGI